MPFPVKHLLIATSAGEETAQNRLSCVHWDVVSAIHFGFQTRTSVERLVIKSELWRNLSVSKRVLFGSVNEIKLFKTRTFILRN
jgi:hypothetical protein